MATEVPLDKLQETHSLEAIVLSTDGMRLLEYGDFINEPVLEALQEFDFDPVVLADNEQDAIELVKDLRYRKASIAEASEEDTLGLAVYDETGDTLLAKAGSKMTRQIRGALDKQGVTSVFLAKSLNPESELRLGRLLLKLQQIKSQSSPRRSMSIELLLEKEAIPEERLIEDSSQITEDFVEQQIEEEQELEQKPAGKPLRASIEPVDPTRVRSIGKVRKIIEIHDNVVKNAEQIFAQVSSRQPVNGILIKNLAAAVVASLVEDSKFTLNLSSINTSKFYLVRHSLNTVLLSVGIGAELDFSAPQVQEMAYGALLHDIGMCRMPPQLLGKPSDLAPEEMLELKRHPIVGIDILQSISRLPRSTPIVVYQENERIDGSGYPKGRKRHFIHTYAQIVGAAAAYDAMVTDRPYRKGKLPYYAMETLLKQVQVGRFDSRIVRALLKTLGLFPVGSWVKLTDGSTARVIGANGERFTRPVVSIVLDEGGTQLDVPRPIDLSHATSSELKVAQPIPAPSHIQGDIRVIGF